MIGKIKKFIIRVLASVYKLGLRSFRGMGLTKIRLIGAARDWFSRTLRAAKPEKVVFRGMTIYLDPNDNLELSIWGDEDHPIVPELKVIENSVSPGDVAVDVGANIGLVALFLSRAAGPAGKVFAFEPEPGNAALLRKNVAANNCMNVEVVEKAVGEKSGRANLFLSDFNVGDHRIYDPALAAPDMPRGPVYDRLAHEGRRKSREVEVVSLDDFFRNIGGKVNFVKMDVQGAEGGVLGGARRVLRENKSVKILMEFWPAGLKMFGVPAEDVLGALGSDGFSFYEVGDGGADKVSPAELLAKYTVPNNRSANLFASR